MGQMREKGEGKWLLGVYIGRIDGKRKYAWESFEGTTSQARKRLVALENEKNTGSLIVPSKQTVKDYIAAWLAGKANVETKTLLDYQHRMEKDVYPFIGAVRLDKLTPAHVRTLYVTLAGDRDLSPRTIRYTHSVLSQALELAVEDGLLAKNPCKRASVLEAIPKKEKTDTAILTPQECVTVWETEPDTMKAALWRLLLTSALRPQEVIPSKWADLSDCMMSVNRATHAIGKGKYEVTDHLKTAGSRRTIALSSETIAALNTWKAAQRLQMLKCGASYVRQDYIFATSKGTPVDIANVRRWWTAALTRCKLSKRRLYVTRHTHLSHLLEAGENPKAVAERSGHSDPSTLLNFYSHTLDGSSKRLAETQEALLRKKA